VLLLLHGQGSWSTVTFDLATVFYIACCEAVWSRPQFSTT